MYPSRGYKHEAQTKKSSSSNFSLSNTITHLSIFHCWAYFTSLRCGWFVGTIMMMIVRMMVMMMMVRMMMYNMEKLAWKVKYMSTSAFASTPHLIMMMMMMTMFVTYRSGACFTILRCNSISTRDPSTHQRAQPISFSSSFVSYKEFSFWCWWSELTHWQS